MWRCKTENPNPFVWDVANYYSYIVATFHADLGFKDPATRSFEFLPIDGKGIRIPKVTYGVALFYLPWHALGHQIAVHTDYENNGFSEPYLECLYWGGVFYSLIAFLFLAAFLRKYFSDLIIAIALAITYLGTNLFYYTQSENLMPHGYLFFLYSIFLYLTQKWFENPKIKNSIGVGVVSGLISLIRPIDAIVVIIFIFWSDSSVFKIKERVAFFLKNYKYILIILSTALLVWLPQLIFWKIRSGNYFLYTYGDEKFFFSDPLFIKVLFSYRKGWLVYTPVAVLFILGFFFMKKEFKFLKFSLFITLFLTIYFIATWWDWFFGGCFSHRAFVQHYAYLIIPLCCFLNYIVYTNSFLIYKFKLKYVLIVFVFSTVSLNLFQSFQYSRRIIHFNSMTAETYWLVFGKSKLNEYEGGYFWNTLKVPDYEKLKKGERDQ